MTEIIDAVPEQIDARRLAAQLVERARAEGIDLVGPGGLLTGLTKTVLETALDAEMAEHLGYDKHDPAGRNGGNSRNGTRSKTVLTEIGPVEIEVPRDRDGSFDPVIVRKRQRRLNGIDQLVLSLTARGLTTGEIAAHFAEVYGAKVSKDTISRITDKVCAEMTEWCQRPLDRVYPVLFIDAIVVKVRDGQVVNRPVYVVVGVTVNGERDILGLWVGDGGEGAKFWLSVLTEVKNRGVEDVCIAVCDGLKGAARRDRHGVAADHGAGVHHPPDPQHVPLRVSPRLGGAQQGPAAGLHRAHRSCGGCPFRRVRHQLGRTVSGHRQAVARGLERVHPVPGLRRGDPPDHLQHKRDRVIERPLPAGGARPRALPDRTSRAEVPLSGHPIPRPDRPRQGEVGRALEAGSQRLRNHLRRPYRPEHHQLTRQTSYTEDRTVPVCWWRASRRVRMMIIAHWTIAA